MIEITFVCIAIVTLIFLYSLYRLMFLKPKENTIGTWKTALFLTILSSLFFFGYFTLTLGSIGTQQVITDGIVEFVSTDNSYMVLFNIMPLVLVMYLLQWLFCIIEILRGISFFGRGRMSFDN